MIGQENIKSSADAPATMLTDNDQISAMELEAQDRRFLEAVIRLGQGRIGQTTPNPSVGALIVRHEKNGPRIVGRGVTGNSGRPHGEVIALEEAGEEARGATCYVGLEPCAHHGKTPPCVHALLDAGIARVVLALRDPDPRVSGKGIEFLEENGIEVVELATRTNALSAHLGHFTRIKEGRPAVRLKLAVSADGMIGRQNEGMISVTGPVARRAVHAMRARSDSILIGIETLLTDNPELTCRLPGMEDWSPRRIVLDRLGRTPLDSRLFETIDLAPVHIFVGPDAPDANISAFMQAGAAVSQIPADEDGLDLMSVLIELADLGQMNLMVEGGATVAASFVKQRLVDRADIFKSSTEIGEDGISATNGPLPLDQMLSQAGLELTDWSQWAEDTLETWVKS